MLRTDLLTFGVTGTVFKIAGEMRRLPAYFDNPALIKNNKGRGQVGFSPLFWVKNEEITEGRKASRASKTDPPPQLKVLICHCSAVCK